MPNIWTRFGMVTECPVPALAALLARLVRVGFLSVVVRCGLMSEDDNVGRPDRLVRVPFSAATRPGPWLCGPGSETIGPIPR